MATAPRQPPAGGQVRTLRGLAAYACGHTGSCCRAGWPIPIDDHVLVTLHQADAAGALPAATQGRWLIDGVLGHTANHECVFHTPAVARAACSLEWTMGSGALPTSCRQFPRVLLSDARGWHQSLSVWCGTAARMVAAGAGPVGLRHKADTCFLSIDHIQVDPRVHVDALDASEAWPPLLRPGVLAGHGAYDQWENRLLQEFLAPVLRGAFPLASALGSALCWTDVLRAWRPSDGALEVLVARPWRHPDLARLLAQPASTSHLASTVRDALMAQVPEAWQPAAWPAGLTDPSTDATPVTAAEAEQALVRYLGTRLFGSWVAYQGDGLRSVAASLVSAYALVALALTASTASPITFGHLTDSMRAADWLLLHLLDRPQWAAWCRAWENAPDARPLIALVAAADRLIRDLPWSPTPASPA